MAAFQNIPAGFNNNIQTPGKFNPTILDGAGGSNVFGPQQPQQQFSGGLLPNIDTGTDSPGFFSLSRGGGLVKGLDTFANLADAFLGFEQLGLNKDAFKFNERLTRTNLGNQAKVTNAAIADRARAAGVQRGTEGTALDQLITAQVNNRGVRGTL